MIKSLCTAGILIIMMTIFSACNSSDVETTNPLAENHHVAEVGSLYSCEDNNYYYNRDLVDFSVSVNAEYETGIIELPIVGDSMPSIIHVDNAQNFYTITQSQNENIFCELGKYNINEKKYTAILTLDNGMTDGIVLGISEDYIVWKEIILTSDEVITKLHLYNQLNKTDSAFFVNNIDPETNSVYEINSNPVVILDNKVFFDEVTGYSAGNIEMNLLCYDIKEKNIILISDMAKRPSPYLDGIAYLKKSENSHSKLFSYVSGKVSAIDSISDDYLNEDTADFSTFDSLIFKSIHNYESEQQKNSVISTSLYLGKDEHLLLKGKQSNYTYGVRSNGLAAVWEVTNPEKPVYYDIMNDRFVRLSDEPSGYYASFITKDAIVFLTYSEPNNEQSPQKYILIKTNED